MVRTFLLDYCITRHSDFDILTWLEGELTLMVGGNVETTMTHLREYSALREGDFIEIAISKKSFDNSKKIGESFLCDSFRHYISK